MKTTDGGVRYSIKPLESELTFDKGLFVFVRAVQLLTSRNKDTIVVGLAGPSGAGKTAFAKKIQALIPGCALLSMDNYNDGSKVIDGNFDDPRITDYDTLLSNLAELKAGRPAQVPIYDFKESKRVGYTTVDVPESRVVILEGIYALSHRLRPHLDLRVSITGGVHFDLVKRVLRDIDRSGQAPEEIIQQVSDTVYPMYKAFIEPDLKAAHLRIYNPFNPFAGFMSPTYILKSATPVAPSAIVSLLGSNAVKKSETETYDIYLVPPGEDPETCQSWLRMRYRDGRYSLMFEEWVVEGVFIISPRVTFEVPVRILGGLMALGYEIGTIMQRTSELFTSPDSKLLIKLDHILGMQKCFVQIQGKDREAVGAAGKALGLEGTYIPHSYIELVQLENLTQSFQTVTEDLKRHFKVNGEPLIEAEHVGSFSRSSSPSWAFGSFNRTLGFGLSSAASPRALRGPSWLHNNTATSHSNDDSSNFDNTSRHQRSNNPDPPLYSSSAPIPMRIATPQGQRSGLLSQKINAAGGGGGGGGSGPAVHAAQAAHGTLHSMNTSNGSSHATENGNSGERGGLSHHKSSSSLGGSSTPVTRHNGGGASRPSSPTEGVEGQLRKLAQSQALLTSQMEELSLQLHLAQSRHQYEEGQEIWMKWGLIAGYASAGAALGCLCMALLLRR